MVVKIGENKITFIYNIWKDFLLGLQVSETMKDFVKGDVRDARVSL